MATNHICLHPIWTEFSHMETPSLDICLGYIIPFFPQAYICLAKICYHLGKRRENYLGKAGSQFFIIALLMIWASLGQIHSFFHHLVNSYKNVIYNQSLEGMGYK